MLSFKTILDDEGLSPSDFLAIRHAFVALHADGEPGVQSDSSDTEILRYTSQQSSDTRKFPRTPPRYWLVFLKDSGSTARLHAVYENLGVASDDGVRRLFHLVDTGLLEHYTGRLVISWSSPRKWWVQGQTASRYLVHEIADRKQVEFPGFNRCLLDYASLQAMVSEPRYERWRSALGAVKGVYLITDMRDGKQYVGKADGERGLFQRWRSYAFDGHGGNIELRNRRPESFQFSILQVFDPNVPRSVVDEAEAHYKKALGSVRFGLNLN